MFNINMLNNFRENKNQIYSFRLFKHFTLLIRIHHQSFKISKKESKGIGL